MNGTNEISRLVNDLAGHWTEPVLRILKAAGMPEISVDLEIETWRTLRSVLKRELHRQPLRSSTLVSFVSLMESVLRKATLLMWQAFGSRGASPEVEHDLGQAASDRVATTSERLLYTEITNYPKIGTALKPLSRTDYLPRLRAVAHA